MVDNIAVYGTKRVKKCENIGKNNILKMAKIVSDKQADQTAKTSQKCFVFDWILQNLEG